MDSFAGVVVVSSKHGGPFAEDRTGDNIDVDRSAILWRPQSTALPKKIKWLTKANVARLQVQKYSRLVLMVCLKLGDPLAGIATACVYNTMQDYDFASWRADERQTEFAVMNSASRIIRCWVVCHQGRDQTIGTFSLGEGLDKNRLTLDRDKSILRIQAERACCVLCIYIQGCVRKSLLKEGIEALRHHGIRNAPSAVFRHDTDGLDPSLTRRFCSVIWGHPVDAHADYLALLDGNPGQI